MKIYSRRSPGFCAALVDLSSTPEVFAAGLDSVGLSNLQTLVETFSPYSASAVEEMAHRIGERAPTGAAGCSGRARPDNALSLLPSRKRFWPRTEGVGDDFRGATFERRAGSLP